MNTSRFEVPLTLPTPHFDDERTVATARQVEPIGHAKVTENWHRLRMLLPLILLATFCGALGAAGVNYYESRQSAKTLTPPVVQNLTPPLQSEPSPVAVAASASPNPDKEKEAVAVAPKTEATPAAEATPATGASPAHDVPPDKPATKPEKKQENPDATTLTRKRRVNPANDDPPIATKKGAARIVDIFGGPNP